MRLLLGELSRRILPYMPKSQDFVRDLLGLDPSIILNLDADRVFLKE